MPNADESPQGDNRALFLNMTASFGIICSLLCVYSAYGVGARRVGAIEQVCFNVGQSRNVGVQTMSEMRVA